MESINERESDQRGPEYIAVEQKIKCNGKTRDEKTSSRIGEKSARRQA